MTDGEISAKVIELFKNDFKPKSIIDRLELKNPIYAVTAAYGHMGRESFEQEVDVAYVNVTEKNGVKTETRTSAKKKVTFFAWEKLNYVDKIKAAFGL
jgi:S-adenosylmethionine synthetase